MCSSWGGQSKGDRSAIGLPGRQVLRLGRRVESQPPQAVQDLLEQREVGPGALSNRASCRSLFVAEIVGGLVCRLVVELTVRVGMR